MNIVEEITNAVKLLDVIENYTDGLCEALSNEDQKISDLLHYIENNNINAAQSCHLIKEIKRVREARRKVKKDMEIAKVYKDNINKLINTENRKMLLSKIHKTCKQLESEYQNRVYTSKDFVEILGDNDEDIRTV